MVTPEEFISQRATRKTAKRLASPDSAISAGTHAKGSAWGNTKTGYRSDIGIVLRSGWEANIARTLMSYGISFEFEPKTFYFPIKRGTRSYTPDFYLPKTQEWIEVKGYFDDKSRIKLKRFAKYFPEEFSNLTMIVGNSKTSLALCEKLKIPRVLIYQDFLKQYQPIIKNWE